MSEPAFGGGPFSPVPGGPNTVSTLDGRVRLASTGLTWTTTHTLDTLMSAMRNGGRVWIRIHCSSLFDVNRRAFSTALVGFVGATSMQLPGGVLESWFHVVPG